MSVLTDLQTKIVADLQSTMTFNTAIEAKINAVQASKNQLAADAEALLQSVQGAGVPVPAAVSAAVAEFANLQPSITAYGTKADAILTAQNQVLTDISQLIAPVTAGTTTIVNQ